MAAVKTPTAHSVYVAASYVALLLALASCSASRPSQALPHLANMPTAMLPSNGGAPGARGTASLKIALPAIQPQGAAIEWSATPYLLSPKTRSISGSVGSRPFGPILLAPSEKGCTTTTAGLVCDVAVRAPVGQRETLRFSTFPSRNGSGSPLATATSEVNIYAGHVNYATPTVYGLAHQIVAQPQAKRLQQGQWAVVPMLVYGVDAAKQTIPSYLTRSAKSGRVVGSVTIALSGLATGTLTGDCCGVIAANFVYAGTSTGVEKFAATGTGFTPNVTKLRAHPGSTAAATMIAGTISASASYVVQFAAGATGNVPPVRTIIPNPGNTAFPAPFGEDAAGNYWVGSTRYSNTGHVLGTVALSSKTDPIARDAAGNIYAISHTKQQPCAVLEYPAKKYGNPAPIREIDFTGCSTVPSTIAVDGHGDVFVSVGDGAEQPLIYEYAPKGSGTLAPIRTIANTSYDTIQVLDTDAAGNLYAMYDNPTPPPHGATPVLFEFAPGATSGQQLVYAGGGAIFAFAVDDAGDVCIGLYVPAIQCFPAGSTTASQSITGPSTLIGYSIGAIALPRSW